MAAGDAIPTANAEAPRLEVLSCPACGAAVPLADGAASECRYCHGQVPIPVEHRELRKRHQGLHETRRRAEAAWQELPRPLPPWLLSTTVMLYVISIPVWTTVCIIGWAFHGWFDNPLTMLTFGIFAPLLLVLFLFVSWFSSNAYAREMGRLCANVLDEGGFGCRVCGAPLEIEPDRVAATCDYCRSDSLLVYLGLAGRSRLSEQEQTAEQSLTRAISTLNARRREGHLARWITGGILLVCWLPFAGLWIVGR